MKRLLFLLAGLLFMQGSIGQPISRIDTITAGYARLGKVSNDTSFFNYPDKRILTRYFNKNIIDALNGYAGGVRGVCDLYLIIDKSGHVTQAWYDQSMNNNIGALSLHQFSDYPVWRPTLIGKEPVVTKLLIRVEIMNAETLASQREESKADFLITVYPPQRKQDISGF
jgi:hypothetical protein